MFWPTTYICMQENVNYNLVIKYPMIQGEQKLMLNIPRTDINVRHLI